MNTESASPAYEEPSSSGNTSRTQGLHALSSGIASLEHPSKRMRLEDLTPNIQTHNRFAFLAIEESDENYEQSSSGSETDEDAGVADADPMLHEEVTNVLARKTVPEPSRKKTARSSGKRSNHSTARAAVKHAVTGWSLKRKHAEVENCDPLIPAPSQPESPNTLSSQTSVGVGAVAPAVLIAPSPASCHT
ncbi:hypothetical protein BD309DRAFT_984921 [Dichomitus squalens]|uniref:Uncharacterized protein n=1 Tax=Dichomitus squalens TaxID=114155 RepID=A0A4Q9PEF4_9APHY|nr:hypothetical protein BD309DRAFT_984921 [Dichomitus squalens]TBU51627.1 hypothetical protein BD310DRAFT_910549 [Dichomitus squalens]